MVNKKEHECSFKFVRINGQRILQCDCGKILDEFEEIDLKRNVIMIWINAQDTLNKSLEKLIIRMLKKGVDDMKKLFKVNIESVDVVGYAEGNKALRIVIGEVK